MQKLLKYQAILYLTIHNRILKWVSEVGHGSETGPLLGKFSFKNAECDNMKPETNTPKVNSTL